MSLIEKVKKMDVSKKIVHPIEPMSDLLKAAIEQEQIERETVGNLGDSGNTGQKTNPYMNGRALWTNIYEGIERKNFNLTRLLAIGALVIAIQSIGLIYMGTQSKIKPVVVEMQNGAVLSVQDVDSSPMNMTDKIVAKTMQDFIIQWRSLTPDNAIEKMWILGNYAHVSGNAKAVLDTYYDQNPPNQLSTQYKTSVVINNVLKLSSSTYQVVWTEYKESLQGLPISEGRYTAQLTYSMDPNAVSPGIVSYNPFGIFIKQITWSQNFNG